MTQMDPGLEGITLATWLYQTLTQDTTLQDMAGGAPALAKRVVEGVYPGDAPWHVSFTILEPVDVKVVGLIQVMASVQAQVKVVGRATSYVPLVPVYRRVHQLLEGRTIPQDVAQGAVLQFGRVSGIQFPESTNGIEYRHLGGLYEALTQ
jgi:hypothetical protein